MDDDEQMDPESSASGETYSLSLEGGGLTVQRDVSEAVAFEILRIVMSGGRGAPQERGVAPAVGRSDGRSTSLREYFDEVQPKRNVDRILAIACYLDVARGVDSFGPDEVKKEFRRAGEAPPGNYSRDFRWAVSAGWIAETEESGQYFVTQKGRDAVNAKFSDEIKKATGVSKAGRRRRQKSKGDEA